MPDPIIPEPSPAWKDIITALKELAIVVGAVAGGIFAGIGQCQGKKNEEGIRVVQQKQDDTDAKIVAVDEKADKLDRTTSRTKEVVQQVEAKIK